MNDSLAKSVEILKGGGVVLMPGDVSWGLACDATNPAPVKKALGCAGTERSPVILMENPALLDRYVDDVPDVAWDLIEISVAPLTLVFHGVRNIAPDLISPEKGSSFRFIREGFAVQLLQRFRKPIAFFPLLSNQKYIRNFSQIPSDAADVADYIAERNNPGGISDQKPSVIRLWTGGKIEIEKP